MFVVTARIMHLPLAGAIFACVVGDARPDLYMDFTLSVLAYQIVSKEIQCFSSLFMKQRSLTFVHA